MKDVLDAYAALKVERDRIGTELMTVAKDFEKLRGFMQDRKLLDSAGGKQLIDVAISHMERLEGEIKLLNTKPVLSDEGRLELMQSNGQG